MVPLIIITAPVLTNCQIPRTKEQVCYGKNLYSRFIMKNLLILLNRVLDALQSSQQGRRSGLSLYGEAAIAKLAAGCCIPFLLPPEPAFYPRLGSDAAGPFS